jgi:hypothetical protein
MAKTPAQIQSFLDDNLHRFDLGLQYLGDEPNSAQRDYATATARWCLLASWPYEAAAGNQSIPAVYKSLHDHDPAFLCDRFYLPATPGDMRLLEKNNIPIFGIETKHPLTDFDVVATSISYPVLSMSFVKMLTMSGIPARWRDRDPNTSPHGHGRRSFLWSTRSSRPRRGLLVARRGGGRTRESWHRSCYRSHRRFQATGTLDD